MTDKEFVVWFRNYIIDKKKLKKLQLEDVKFVLKDVYNELPEDIAIREEYAERLKNNPPPSLDMGLTTVFFL